MYIKEVIKARGWTLSAIAKELGVTQGALSQSINKNPTAATLEKIAFVIGCNPGEFFMDRMSADATATCPHCGKPLTIKIS